MAFWSVSTTGALTARRTDGAWSPRLSWPTSDQLDFGSWKDRWDDFEAPEITDPERRTVLTLQRLLSFVADYDRRVELAIETKHPTRYAGLVERQLVQLLDRFGWAHPRRGGEPSPARVMSFSALSMRRMRQLAPSIPTVLLMERVPLRMRDGSLPVGVRIAGASIDIVRAHPRYPQRAHAKGNRVHVWTVDRTADVELCVDAGVDAIITNRPAKVIDLLNRRALTP